VILYDKILFSEDQGEFWRETPVFYRRGRSSGHRITTFLLCNRNSHVPGIRLSEASPVISSNAVHAIKFGSSGRLVKYMDLKIVMMMDMNFRPEKRERS
jgi:long-chain acyl-CoA synthetase